VKSVIENGVRNNTRSLFLIVGDHGKDQVENIHRILSTMRVKARPSVLWCYKKDLGFSTHRKKRMKEIKTAQARGLYDNERDDPFDLFISSTNIRWTYYKETEKVLGQTFGMCVLQDFEALTPNILARTIETVEGGGIIILLIKTVHSLKQLYTMTMDVHSRFRTEAHHEVIPRFNERFILSLCDCNSCLVLDDELNVLPISSKVHDFATSSGSALVETRHDAELTALKTSLVDTPYIGNLVEKTRTVDQARAVMSFLDSISDKMTRATVSLTAGRGRGKSAALGLCLAGAVAFGYANIFVTAPSPENLKTCFEFIVSGLQSLQYVEHVDFEVVYDQVPEVGKVMTRINIFRAHRQIIQYILPQEHYKLAQAELVAIDEAAAIPLPVVKQLLGPYVVFMSSTINGYEGTGRALSLKLLSQLRQQQGAAIAAAAQQAGDNVVGAKQRKGERKVHEERWKVAAETAKSMTIKVRSLVELSLNEPIRYGRDDPVEKWLNKLLCLDSTSDNSHRIVGSMPAPRDCDLYIVDRDALFSYHPLAEGLLHRIWSLYTAAHYKNAPNDLQMLSDAPAHRLFVLLGPRSSMRAASGGLPDVLCVVQVAFEGRISQASVQAELSRGNKASGDLIPWTVSQQFNDSQFASLSGARIVRIATHPDLQSMGYGSRALDLLVQYFQGQLSAESLPLNAGVFGGESGVSSTLTLSRSSNASAAADLLNEDIQPRATLPPLLTPLADRPCERLHWLGSSFGLTSNLLTFWSRKGFQVSYLRQTASDVTGEHSCIVLREMDCADVVNEMSGTPLGGWLAMFEEDYRRRLISLMSFSFHKLSSALALALLDPTKKLTSVGTQQAQIGGDGTDGDAATSAAVDATMTLTADILLRAYLTHHDLKRLELYSRNLVDHHVVLDLVPTLARLFFSGALGQSFRLSFLQAAILLATGLQHKDVDDVCKEMDLPSNQVLAFFNKSLRKIVTTLRGVVESEEGRALLSKEATMRVEVSARGMVPLASTLADVQASDEAEYQLARQRNLLMMQEKELSKHTVKVDDAALSKAAQKSHKKDPAATAPSIVSVPKSASTGDNDGEAEDDDEAEGEEGKAQDKKQKKPRHKKLKSRDASGDDDDDIHQKKKHKKHY
jgi:N-acetyltransferase 10